MPFKVRWSHDGRELFYANRGTLMSAPVAGEREFSAGTPKPVLQAPANTVDADVGPDGHRFLVARLIAPARLGRIVIALGGTTDIGRPAP